MTTLLLLVMFAATGFLGFGLIGKSKIEFREIKYSGEYSQLLQFGCIEYFLLGVTSVVASAALLLMSVISLM